MRTLDMNEMKQVEGGGAWCLASGIAFGVGLVFLNPVLLVGGAIGGLITC
jgi:bacteriocin-like protein